MTHRHALTATELRALVSLLEDRDPGIQAHCRERLMREGERALAFLRDAAASPVADRELCARALAELQGMIVDAEFQAFAARSGDLDLEEGVLLLARTRDPALDVEAVRRQLDQLAARVRSRLPAGADSGTTAGVFADVLGRQVDLRGNAQCYYDPDNSYLDLVLERGVGIPISLSAVYLLVARRLGVPMLGIGMPGHFLVRCGNPGVLLDPFRRGRIMTREECFLHLVQSGIRPAEDDLDPVSDRRILTRWIANLVNAYDRRDDEARSARYRRLLDCVSGRAGSGRCP